MPRSRKNVIPEGDNADHFIETRKRPLVLKNESDVNKVRRMGIPLETKKKMYAATNKQRLEMKSFRKLENETEELRHPKIPQSVGQMVMRRRNQLGMSQAQLASKIKQSTKLVAQLESSGEVVYNNGLIKRLELVLGVRLIGKDCGKALANDENCNDDAPSVSKPLTRAAKKKAEAEAAKSQSQDKEPKKADKKTAHNKKTN